jgi:hypothetical protein
LVDPTGQWRVVHRVEQSTRARYVGLKIEFAFSLSEFGGSVVGSGKKVRVNDKPTPDGELSVLEITGRVSGDEVTLSLLERRESNTGDAIVGEIAWHATGPDQLRGRFVVDAGESQGSSEASRVSQLG